METKKETGKECEVCGRFEAKRQYPIPLWNYGRRQVKDVWACEGCIEAQEEGNL